ncbi:MAG: ABC transporter ATP-binding protein, partial [Erysipelotrichaceae bacterium]|nr:ABC transporter ATP-binding protein [Erysipelotrichaceae bacterium]
PYSGTIEFDGVDISRIAAHKIVEMGVAQCPERRRIFASQSVEDNLLLGAYTRKDKEEIEKDLRNVYELFPRLEERKKQLGGTLSGGEQQMLAMGRALMSKPKIMLLDEPSMGLSPLLVKEIFSIIKEINENGTSILLVEQNAKMALSIAQRAYVIETGRIVMSGTGEQLLNSEDIRKAYLGG